MFFPGDVIIIPLVVSVPLFLWQLWLCRKERSDHSDLLPLLVPGITLLLALGMFAFGDGSGFLDLSSAVAAIVAVIGLWFLIVIALAWLTAHIIGKFSK